MKTRGDVLMKAEEARRAFVIKQAVAGAFTVREAGEVLGLSYRQVIRLKNPSVPMRVRHLPLVKLV
jgi:hypothetical protein